MNDQMRLVGELEEQNRIVRLLLQRAAAHFDPTTQKLLVALSREIQETGPQLERTPPKGDTDDVITSPHQRGD